MRRSKPGGVCGEAHGRHKFPDSVVKVIRHDRHDKRMKLKDIAKKHGCSISTVSEICTNKTRQDCLPEGAVIGYKARKPGRRANADRADAG